MKIESSPVPTPLSQLERQEQQLMQAEALMAGIIETQAKGVLTHKLSDCTPIDLAPQIAVKVGQVREHITSTYQNTLLPRVQTRLVGIRDQIEQKKNITSELERLFAEGYLSEGEYAKVQQPHKITTDDPPPPAQSSNGHSTEYPKSDIWGPIPLRNTVPAPRRDTQPIAPADERPDIQTTNFDEKKEDLFKERRQNFKERLDSLKLAGYKGLITEVIIGHVDPSEGIESDDFALAVYTDGRDLKNAKNGLSANLNFIRSDYSKVGLRVGSILKGEGRGKRSNYFLEEIPQKNVEEDVDTPSLELQNDSLESTKSTEIELDEGSSVIVNEVPDVLSGANILDPLEDSKPEVPHSHSVDSDGTIYIPGPDLNDEDMEEFLNNLKQAKSNSPTETGPQQNILQPGETQQLESETDPNFATEKKDDKDESTILESAADADTFKDYHPGGLPDNSNHSPTSSESPSTDTSKSDGGSESKPEKHKHRWRIDEPNGAVSQGVCKGCGANKDFKNWLEDTDVITNTEHRAGIAQI